jgi:hypothetical protein
MFETDASCKIVDNEGANAAIKRAVVHVPDFCLGDLGGLGPVDSCVVTSIPGEK